MDMNDDERAALAAMVKAERVRQHGTQLAAYQAARVNAATWKRIEAGEPVRDDRLTAAVRLLWPASGGDWRKVSTATQPDRPLKDYPNRALLDELEARLTETGLRDGNDEGTTSTQAEGISALKTLRASGEGHRARRSAATPPRGDDHPD